VLNGIVDRPVAAGEGFKYSDVFQEKAAEGAVWSEEELAAFLASPRKYAKGTKMAFPGLRKDAEIAAVIAYLATFK
jgi:cytochrome c